MFIMICLSIFIVAVSSSVITAPSQQERLLAPASIIHAAIIDNEKFGIGFDFSLTYAAAAISFPNGTSFAVAQIDGIDEYKDFMRRVTLPSSMHIAPPYNSLDEWLKDYPRQQLRKLRKSLGLPASKDAGILGQMVKDLRRETEDFLSHEIEIAAGSFPDLIALYDEEVWDAFEWAGIEHQQSNTYHDLTWQVEAIFAASGFGLCPDYRNSSLCKDWNRQYPNLNLEELHVLYTREALHVALTRTRTAYWHFLGPHTLFTDFSFGSKAATGDEDYWHRMHKRFMHFLNSNAGNWRWAPPSKIFVYGESADNPVFRKLVREVARWNGNEPQFFDKDPIFMPAKGTAELAKRAFFLNPRNLRAT